MRPRFALLVFAAAAAAAALATSAWTGKVAVSGSPPAAAAGADVPDTPAGRRLAEWLAAFNAGDRAALARFHAERFTDAANGQTPPERRAEMQSMAAGFSGGLTLTKVEPLSDTRLEADATMKLTGDPVRVRVAVEESEPHGVVELSVQTLPRPAAPSPGGRPSDEEIAKRLGEHLDRLAAAGAFSGVVLVAKDGEPIFARPYGMADEEAGAANRIDTRFSLASMGKMFTAVAVLRLAAEGKLSLDDTVGEHLPGYPNRQVAEKVTVRHLLSHTSGLGDFFGEKWNENRSKVRTLDDHLALFSGDEIAFEPGTRWRYSNAGYVLLGAILEKAAGRSYEEVIAEQVFEPAGMRDSGFFSPEDEAPNRAVGYTRMGVDGKPLPGTAPQPIRHGRGGPAGGVWSTAEDLLRFSEALRTHALLDAETTAAATSMRAESGMGPGAGYGYGFETQNINGARVFGHYGGFPGVSAGLEVYPDLGYTVVILSNTDMGGQRVVGRIHDWLTSH